MKRAWLTVMAGTLAILGGTPAVQGQSADALIDKLIAKGVLTEEEAKDLREQSDNGFNSAYSVKSGMPDWVTSLKLNGDIRARYENFDSADYADRNRLRFRMRFGAVASFRDNLEAGLRLTSSEPSGNFGGDPISGNTTFRDNGSKKFVYIDLAYGKWTMLNTPDFSSVWTVGKMENPFAFSDMVFDGDYTPEGVAQQFAYHLSHNHDLKLNLGGFVVDENYSADNSGQNNDPWMFGAQARWDATWSPKLQTSMGLGFLSLMEEEDLPTAAVPNQNAGNQRAGAAGNLINEFNTFVADASATYTLESFPFYSGAFPIKVGGEVMHNIEASGNNMGWWAGVTFGKSGKKRTWDLTYRYKSIEADAWFEEVVDSDFGAFSGAASRYGYGGTGYYAGTNVRGHIVKASYSPFDALTLSVTYFLTELVDNPNTNVDDGTGRLQVDAMWKF